MASMDHLLGASSTSKFRAFCCSCSLAACMRVLIR
jgi:hypothetical protein